MNDLAKRVGAAAAAAWWTVLILVAWLSCIWAVWMSTLGYRPEWVRCAIRADMSWREIGWMMVIAVGVMKLIVFIVIILAIWLSIWSLKLRQRARLDTEDKQD